MSALDVNGLSEDQLDSLRFLLAALSLRTAGTSDAGTRSCLVLVMLVHHCQEGPGQGPEASRASRR